MPGSAVEVTYRADIRPSFSRQAGSGPAAQGPEAPQSWATAPEPTAARDYPHSVAGAEAARGAAARCASRTEAEKDIRQMLALLDMTFNTPKSGHL